MLIDSIAIIVLGLSLISLAVIIGRKFPTLAAIDTSAPAEATAGRKRNIIEERLRRKVSMLWTKVAGQSTPIAVATGRLWTAAHKKLIDLEHEYKVRSLPVFLSRRQRRKIDHEIAAMLEQARALVDDKEYAAAEEKALQAIRLEPRSVPAFELLGQLYLVTKEHGHAKEVYQYLLKLTGDSDAIYEHLGSADLGAGHLAEARDELQHAVELNRTVATYHLELAQVYTALGDAAKAFTSIQEAVRLEPNNPKLLDQYVEISIAAGKKQFAEDAVARIEAVNPENSKIAEWRERITAIEGRPLTNLIETSDTADSTTSAPL
ncbi:MAG: tetratricopeptide repeat protein [Patescibacteria group bacterium]